MYIRLWRRLRLRAASCAGEQCLTSAAPARHLGLAHARPRPSAQPGPTWPALGRASGAGARSGARRREAARGGARRREAARGGARRREAGLRAEP
jgi:hypothetical protein